MHEHLIACRHSSEGARRHRTRAPPPARAGLAWLHSAAPQWPLWANEQAPCHQSQNRSWQALPRKPLAAFLPRSLPDVAACCCLCHESSAGPGMVCCLCFCSSALCVKVRPATLSSLLCRCWSSLDLHEHSIFKIVSEAARQHPILADKLVGCFAAVFQNICMRGVEQLKITSN